jgi:hypothetical protein
MIDGSFADPCLLDNVVDGGGVIAFFCETEQGTVQQYGSPLFFICR